MFLFAYVYLDKLKLYGVCVDSLAMFLFVNMMLLLMTGMIPLPGSKRHSLQVVELSQQTRTAVQIVSNPPAPSNGGPIYRFLGMPAMRTRWMAGAAAHKSG